MTLAVLRTLLCTALTALALSTTSGLARAAQPRFEDLLSPEEFALVRELAATAKDGPVDMDIADWATLPIPPGISFHGTADARRVNEEILKRSPNPRLIGMIVNDGFTNVEYFDRQSVAQEDKDTLAWMLRDLMMKLSEQVAAEGSEAKALVRRIKNLMAQLMDGPGIETAYDRVAGTLNDGLRRHQFTVTSTLPGQVFALTLACSPGRCLGLVKTLEINEYPAHEALSSRLVFAMNLKHKPEGIGAVLEEGWRHPLKRSIGLTALTAAATLVWVRRRQQQGAGPKGGEPATGEEQGPVPAQHARAPSPPSPDDGRIRADLD